ncbi:hypothetical protein SCALIN_C01_0239 [Candidatus Scalindua japonica]|uniref:Lcl C-terminal domain-containing protein n=1 Tax=Candidatus Scalindua japonica TaxID=1284222 RepID=A0A286TTW7_9BACT|nr:DUF1566 domain-containing protein [Candidatus Scalindua japonica]GAX59308.1 hypothetical protein SCALIN_C01_0239 [Candidatus Scalindua japonica]
MKKLLILVFAFLLCSPTSQATLIDNLDGTITDTNTDLMWLQDTRYAMTSGYDHDGNMDWYEAMEWAETLSFGGFNNWRLPSMDVNGDMVIVDGSSVSATELLDNEYAYMYYFNGITPFIPDVFTNFAPSGLRNYWSSTLSTTDLDNAHHFLFVNGGQSEMDKEYGGGYLWAVRDINSVPEPTIITLFCIGIVGLAGAEVRRRRKKKAVVKS